MRYHCPIFLFALGLAGLANAAETPYARPRLLMEPAELAKPEVARQFVILDARKQEAYAAEHIPGAWVIRKPGKRPLPMARTWKGWSKRIGQLGIDASAKVVVYDDVSNPDAARIWWTLRYFGVGDRAAAQWRLEGVEVGRVCHEFRKGPAPRSRPSLGAAPRKKRLVIKDQVLRSLTDKSLQIVDARSEKEYCGIDLKENARGGAIPGAKHLEWSELVDPATGRFKSPEDLKQIFDKAGIDLTRPIASHCQSGGRASVMAFGLELMGAKDPRNYYRGWSEWGNLDDAPIVTAERK